MKTRWKWTLIGTACIAVVAAALPVAAAYLADRKLHRQVAVPAAPLNAGLPGDARSLEHGRYLFESRGCAECHGANGAGRVFARDGRGLMLKSPNITRGAGGVVANYRDEDWVRAIRHGVKPDGHPVFIMPSEDYARLSSDDVADIASYARQLPPVPGSGAAFEVPLIMRALYAAGLVKDAAEKIDHGLPPPPPSAASVSAGYGRYVASMCIGCHGVDLAGGKLPGHPPDWPPAARLRPGKGSVLPRYPTPESFIAMLRSGKRPDGSRIDKAMPFESLGKLSEIDARALYLFLTTQSAAESGSSTATAVEAPARDPLQP